MAKQTVFTSPKDSNVWLRLIAWCSLAILAVLLLTQHAEHLLSVLPYLLLLLACPLMHLFLHRRVHSATEDANHSRTHLNDDEAAKAAKAERTTT
jgi:hypothetical protein